MIVTVKIFFHPPLSVRGPGDFIHKNSSQECNFQKHSTAVPGKKEIFLHYPGSSAGHPWLRQTRRPVPRRLSSPHIPRLYSADKSRPLNGFSFETKGLNPCPAPDRCTGYSAVHGGKEHRPEDDPFYQIRSQGHIRRFFLNQPIPIKPQTRVFPAAPSIMQAFT